MQDTILRMTFAVKQQNEDKLTDLLMRVSDPKSSEYGTHPSKAEVEQLVAPLPESVRCLCTGWLLLSCLYHECCVSRPRHSYSLCVYGPPTPPTTITIIQINAVREFVVAHGVTGCEESSSGDFIHCDMSVATAETMLAVKYVSTIPLFL